MRLLGTSAHPTCAVSVGAGAAITRHTRHPKTADEGHWASVLTASRGSHCGGATPVLQRIWRLPVACSLFSGLVRTSSGRANWCGDPVRRPRRGLAAGAETRRAFLTRCQGSSPVHRRAIGTGRRGRRLTTLIQERGATRIAQPIGRDATDCHARVEERLRGVAGLRWVLGMARHVAADGARLCRHQGYSMALVEAPCVTPCLCPLVRPRFHPNGAARVGGRFATEPTLA